jgi:RNA polymerase sigma-70 factor, ECF subfamily
VSDPTAESVAKLPVLSLDTVCGAPDDVEASVLALFDRCAPALLRYVGSFGLNAAETEDVVQDTFLALFRHLHLGRDRTNLTGWLYQVAHNMALKRRQQAIKHVRHQSADETALGRRPDPAPDPEERLLGDERQRRLRAVFDALPDRERRCVFLRAEGLTYRDIAKALSVSLGSVSKALTRAVTRLMHADGG